MKKIIFAFVLASILLGCKTVNNATSLTSASKEEVQVNINLSEIKNDKVLVTVKFPRIQTDEITYHIPKMVPGTYSDDNFGRFIVKKIWIYQPMPISLAI